jgi:hypothetical protein
MYMYLTCMYVLCINLVDPHNLSFISSLGVAAALSLSVDLIGMSCRHRHYVHSGFDNLLPPSAASAGVALSHLI